MGIYTENRHAFFMDLHVESHRVTAALMLRVVCGEADLDHRDHDTAERADFRSQRSRVRSPPDSTATVYGKLYCGSISVKVQNHATDCLTLLRGVALTR